MNVPLEAPYPRDLIGYGRTPPQADWPDGARLAVQFVINYEEGGESCILHGDAHSEAFLSEIVGAQPWFGQRHMNMESVYEYGSRVGFWRLWRLFTARKMPVTVFSIASALDRNREAAAAMQEANWEIASHGLKWLEYREISESEERRHIDEAILLQKAVTGARPLGFYQGRTSSHSLRLAMEEQGFLYCADSYADDLPYWIGGPHGPQLVVPYTLDANDMRFSIPAGFSYGEEFFAYLKDSFDVLYAEGASVPKMLSVGLHCRLVGRPGRAAALERFLDYIAAKPDVWVTTRLDIARHWVRRHLPVGLKPSGMHRALFVERFGGVYEHTPVIAEATHRAGLTATQDDAEGLHKAMEAQVRLMPADVLLALVQAHPDLAGKLAEAKRLTDESEAEQSGAGLNALTDGERSQFTALNDAYKAKFGFPFIVSVRGLTKADIVAQFKARLENDREAEFSQALAQISRITLLRLRELLPG